MSGFPEDFRRMWSTDTEDWKPEERAAMNFATVTALLFAVLFFPIHTYPVIDYETYLLVQRATMGLYAGLGVGVGLARFTGLVQEATA